MNPFFFFSLSFLSLFNFWFLGRCYQLGIGVEMNLKKSTELFKTSKDGGFDYEAYLSIIIIINIKVE